MDYLYTIMNLDTEHLDEICEDIKNQYREEYSFRKFSVEHFSIDIDKFINENKIEKRDIYYLIGNEGEKIKIQYTA